MMLFAILVPCLSTDIVDRRPFKKFHLFYLCYLSYPEDYRPLFTASCLTCTLLSLGHSITHLFAYKFVPAHAQAQS